MPRPFPLFPWAGWRRATAGSGWLLADRLTRMGLGFSVAVALARLLGPAAYGQFIYATTLAALFLPLVSLGLERVVVRELARSPDARPGLLGAAAALRLSGGVLSSALALAAVLALGHGDPNVRWMVSLIAVGNVFLASDVIDWAYQAEGRFRGPVLARLAGFAVGAGAKVALAAAGAPLVWLAGAVCGEMALTGLLLALCGRGLHGAAPRFWIWQRRTGLRLLAASWPLFFAEIAGWLFQRLDLVILNRFGSEAEVGRYAVAVRVTQAAFFLPVVAVQVLSPAMARAAHAHHALALAARAMKGLVAIGYAISVALAFGARWFIPLLFGRKYAAAAGLFSLLAWTNVFVFMGCCHALYLVAIDQQRISLRLTWVTAFCSIALNLALIPRWQSTGAATATLATYGLSALFGVALFRESRPLFRLNLEALIAPARWLFDLARGANPPAAPAD